MSEVPNQYLNTYAVCCDCYIQSVLQRVCCLSQYSYKACNPLCRGLTLLGNHNNPSQEMLEHGGVGPDSTLCRSGRCHTHCDHRCALKIRAFTLQIDMRQCRTNERYSAWMLRSNSQCALPMLLR